MELVTTSDLNPDLIINRESVIDRIGRTASISAEQHRPNYDKQIKVVREQAKKMCPKYSNCKQEDWCWHCASGQNGVLFRGATCLGCKLMTSDALIQIKARKGGMNVA